jgi:signal transduction histidine kinase/ligand-binding sensor domain-containing protein
MGWRCLALTWLLWLASASIHAAPPDADDLSYERRRWTQADGAPQQSYSIAQTQDGLLWFSSAVGLYSFDGIRFKQVNQIYGHTVPAGSISFVAALPEGLAVGFQFGGLSIFSRIVATQYTSGKNFPLGTVMNIAADAKGALYAATSTGLYRRSDGKWGPYGAGLPAGVISSIGFDREQVMWASVYSKQYARKPGTDTFVLVDGPDDYFAGITSGYMQALVPNRGFVQLSLSAPPRPLHMEQQSLYKMFLLDGPYGTLWAPRDDGFARLARRPDGTLYAVELFPNRDKAGGMITNGLVDREGNLWLTTSEGVERYHRHRFHHVDMPSDGYQWLAQRGFEEELWFGADNKPVVRLGAAGEQLATGVTTADSILRLAPDHVWVGSRGKIWEFKGKDSKSWDLPPQIRKDYDVQALAMESSGGLLVSILRSGVWRFAQGAWTQDARLGGMAEPTPLSMLTDSKGKTWLGFTGNRLGLLTPSALQMLPASANLQIGNVLSMLEVDGKLLVGGELGVAWISGAKALPLRLSHVANFRRVTGLLVDAQGSLWMHCNDGLYRANAAELKRFWVDPGQTLEAQLFDFEDGIRGTAAQQRPLPSLALAHNGRVFYATTSQVGWIDPVSIRNNTRPPEVLIETLNTPRENYYPADGLTLPQGTTSIDLAFTATALTVPERVRIKYRLEGFDADWREVQHERSAQYTNLKPGHYRFHVIAANEDGVWNSTGAQLQFEILPAYWQTWWFQWGCVSVLLLIGLLLYRWRLQVVHRHAEERVSARLEATLQERSRIARSLHDNLLQAIHALLMRFQVVQSRLSREPELQSMLDKALDYAERLVESTRDEVMGLRSAPAPELLLADLRAAMAAAEPAAERLLKFETAGEPRALRDEVGVEVVCVLREAVLNSVHHAQASQILVRLQYADSGLQGEVSDDGVGMESAVAQHGRSGHWGIAGMLERVQRLDGEINVRSEPGRGVTVTFSIPARRAYV